MGKDSRTGMFGEPHQIDGDVDFHGTQERGDLEIALASNIEKAIEALPDAGVDFRIFPGTE